MTAFWPFSFSLVSDSTFVADAFQMLTDEEFLQTVRNLFIFLPFFADFVYYLSRASLARSPWCGDPRVGGVRISRFFREYVII